MDAQAWRSPSIRPETKASFFLSRLLWFYSDDIGRRLLHGRGPPASAMSSNQVMTAGVPACAFSAPGLSISNSFCQSNRHDDNASQVFYFRSVLPSAAGRARQRVGNQGQPFRVPVQFAPATHVGVPGHKEINGTVKFMRPVFLRRDCAFLSIDMNN